MSQPPTDSPSREKLVLLCGIAMGGLTARDPADTKRALGMILRSLIDFVPPDYRQAALDLVEASGLIVT